MNCGVPRVTNLAQLTREPRNHRVSLLGNLQQLELVEPDLGRPDAIRRSARAYTSSPTVTLRRSATDSVTASTGSIDWSSCSMLSTSS